MARIPQRITTDCVSPRAKQTAAYRSQTYGLDRAALLVEIRPDIVIIRSPESLLEPLSVSTIRQAARNPDVIDVLRQFNLAGDTGRGVDVIQDGMDEALLAPIVRR